SEAFSQVPESAKDALHGLVVSLKIDLAIRQGRASSAAGVCGIGAGNGCVQQAAQASGEQIGVREGKSSGAGDLLRYAGRAVSEGGKEGKQFQMREGVLFGGPSRRSQIDGGHLLCSHRVEKARG